MTRSLLLDVTIPIAPVPKARPRVTRHGTHTPDRTRNFESLAGWYLRAAMGTAGLARVDRPRLLQLEAVFILARPQRLPKNGHRCWHGVRPDLDNLLKALKDAMDKVVMEDDSQIVSLTAEKWYASSEENPSIIVRLSEWCRVSI